MFCSRKKRLKKNRKERCAHVHSSLFVHVLTNLPLPSRQTCTIDTEPNRTTKTPHTGLGRRRIKRQRQIGLLGIYIYIFFLKQAVGIKAIIFRAHKGLVVEVVVVAKSHSGEWTKLKDFAVVRCDVCYPLCFFIYRLSISKGHLWYNLVESQPQGRLSNES